MSGLVGGDNFSIGPGRPRTLTQEQELEREEWAWHYRIRGWPVSQIARQLTTEHGLRSTPGDVTHALAKRRNELQAMYLDEALQQRLQQVQVLEFHAMRAFQEFERSCQDVEVQQVETGRATLNRDGGLVDLPDRTVVTRRAQAGSPALLSAGFEALGQIRKILGYNAPEEMRLETQDGSGAEVLTERLRQMAERLRPALPGVVVAEEATEPTNGMGDH